MSHTRRGVPTLTTQQKIFYEENGYILIENNVNHKLLDECTQRFVNICNGETDHDVGLIMKDPVLRHQNVKGEYLINKFQDFLYDKIFWKYASDDNVVDVVEAIIGPNVTAAHSMFINKPPNTEEGASLHPLHQDMHYFPFRPADKIVASWTAVERVDERNGCLYVIPGSHKGPLYEHTYPEGFKNKMYHGVQGMDHVPKKFVIMEKGDTVFFHPHLLHGSGPNKTQGFRKAISCHYADSNCQFINVKGTIQENIAEEIEERAKRLGASLTFNEVWKAKSRLIRGKPGNFQNFDSSL